jgi:hypothetical protein
LAVVGGSADQALFVELLNAGAVPVVFAAIDTDVLAAGLGQRATLWDQCIREWRGQAPGDTGGDEISR